MRRLAMLVAVAVIAALLAAPAAFRLRSGMIEGTVFVPSCDGITADLKVCAERIDQRGTRNCTESFRLTAEGYSYQLRVLAGVYLVYSESKEIEGGAGRAYFSRAVLCGLSVSCLDHRPIPVVIEAGGTRGGVDPVDWYSPAEDPRKPGEIASGLLVQGSPRSAAGGTEVLRR